MKIRKFTPASKVILASTHKRLYQARWPITKNGGPGLGRCRGPNDPQPWRFAAAEFFETHHKLVEQYAVLGNRINHHRLMRMLGTKADTIGHLRSVSKLAVRNQDTYLSNFAEPREDRKEIVEKLQKALTQL